MPCISCLLLGKALEELRASMFSKLRSVSGSKRQQQSLWAPSVALTFNFLVSVSIILMNKLVRNIPLLLLSLLCQIFDKLNLILFVFSGTCQHWI